MLSVWLNFNMFSRQEYWSGLPFPSPGELPNPGIKPGSPALQADALTSETPGKPPYYMIIYFWFVICSHLKMLSVWLNFNMSMYNFL